MTYTSIMEKILCLVQLVRKSWITLLFLGVVLFFLILLGWKKISKRVGIGFILISYLCLLGYTIYQNLDHLVPILNSITDNFFTSIYFPSAYIYLFVLGVVDIVTLGSLFNIRGEKIYKVIHGICFFLLHFVFVLILNIVSDNQIDIFSKTSLFGNKDLIMLLEFSVNIFLLWIISLVTVYIINVVTDRILVMKANRELKKMPAVTMESTLAVEEEVKEETPLEPVLSFIPKELLVNQMKEEVEVAPSFQPQNISHETVQTSDFTNSFDLSDLIAPQYEKKPITDYNHDVILDQILNNQLPLTSFEQPTNTVGISYDNLEKDTYTLNDYRIFNKMLKDIKEYNQNNTVTIDKNMEYRLITKYSNETYDMFKRMLKIYSN